MYPNSIPSGTNNEFLAGGGEMGTLIRSLDWSDTTIGAVENWPKSLLTTVGIVLNSNLPMFLFWGSDLNCFYNDSFRPILHEETKDYALGKPAKTALHDIWGYMESIINRVFSGESVSNEDQLIPVLRNGEIEDVYWTFRYSPVRDDNGKISGALVICNETTIKVDAFNKLQEKEDLLRFAIDATELGTWDYNPITNKFTGNNRLKSWFGINADAEIDLNLAINVIQDSDKSRVVQSIQNALHYKSGGLYDTEYTIIHPTTLKERIVRAKGKAWFNSEKKAYRFNGTLQDITEQVIIRRKLEQSESYFRELTDTVPAIIWITDPDGMCTYLNKNWFDYTGQTKEEAEGFGWLNATHPDDLQRTSKDFKEANANKKAFNSMYRLRDKNGNYRWTIDMGSPKFNAEGVYEGMIGTVLDVHEQKEAEEKIKQSEHILSLLIDESPIRITFLTGPEMTVRLANETVLKSWGRDKSVLGLPLREILPELEGQSFLQILENIYETGIPYIEKNASARLRNENRLVDYYFDLWYIPMFNQQGKVYGILANAVDVTEKVLARQKIEQAEERARLAIESADLGSYEISLINNDMVTSERFNAIWGVSHSIQREEFANYIHPDFREIRDKAHKEAVLTGNLHYETIIIWPDQSEHWVKIKGKVLYDIDNNPITLLGIIQDITEQKHFAEELSKQVKDRTLQLSRSNDDLLQFAHVASHDLKEPVRKIKMFSNMIDMDYGHLLPERGVNYLGKVQHATDRMFMMIEGVLTYSSLNASNQPIQEIDLNEIILNIESDLEVLIQQKNAVIKRANLPVLKGAPVLIFQLFYNLVNNALKFSKEGQQSTINISSEIEDDHLKIVVSDNGIGLDPQYTHKIFDAFTRLNAKDAYEGTGLGLALCKRIVERHHGRIEAFGIKGEKAEFTIYLPLLQTDHII